MTCSIHGLIFIVVGTIILVMFGLVVDLWKVSKNILNDKLMDLRGKMQFSCDMDTLIFMMWGSNGHR
jgi:hypothetical protein